MLNRFLIKVEVLCILAYPHCNQYADGCRYIKSHTLKKTLQSFSSSSTPGDAPQKKRTCQQCGCWKLPHNGYWTAKTSTAHTEMNMNVVRKKPKWKKLINDEQKIERKNTNWWREAYKTWCPHSPPAGPLLPAPPLSTMSFIQPNKQNEKKNNRNTS